jgi:hypothetical protein
MSIRLDLPGDLFPSDFPPKILYVFLISSMRVTCFKHFNLFDLIILRIFFEEWL